MPGKGDLSDRTWQYIVAALARGREMARSKGFKWKGDSCFYANVIALWLVIATRRGCTIFRIDRGPTLKTNNPLCIELAYADHYLQARMVASLFGAAGAISTNVARFFYDPYKDIIRDMQDAGKAQMPDLLPNPMSQAGAMPDSFKVAMAVRAMFGAVVGPLGDRLAQELQETSAPLSRSTPENVYWVNLGGADGRGDYQIGDLIAQLEALKSQLAALKS
jgi:hypothetical protein